MLPSGSANPWAVIPARSPAPRLRLYCFPCAGAGAGFYRPWRPRIPTDIELILVQLPGRETRFREAPFTRMDALIPALAQGLAPLLPGAPSAFFGHSMGALVAYETARHLHATGAPTPRHLLLSGHRAPHLPPARPPTHPLPDATLDAELLRLGGTPPEVLAHPELMALLRPAFRADLTLCETYTHRHAEPLPMAATLYGGAADPDVPPATLDAWRAHLRGPVTTRILPGGHFFLQDPHFLPILAHDLAPLANP